VKEGTDIQSIFFEMWREDHPEVALADVPGDLVTASGSGLDPHITVENARFQLERVASAWAKDTKRDPAEVGHEIEALLQQKTFAPAGGLFGVPMVNVLDLNLELRKRYGDPAGSST
jgi:K+-transporting ATPase ATPase C chain